VPETITLPKLHSILQWTMGWTNSHLHEYEIGQHRYGMLDDERFDHNPPLDERRVRFKPLLDAGVRRLTYLLELTRFSGHLIVRFGGVHNGKQKYPVYAGV
jgi:hypothetical protein